MIEELRKNIETEIHMLREISVNSRRAEFTSDIHEKRLLEASIAALKRSIKTINRSIPHIIKDISPTKKIPSKKTKKTNLTKIEFKGDASTIKVVLTAEDKEKLLKDLSINENLVRKLKKKKKTVKTDTNEFKAARGYLKLSNKLFLDLSNKHIDKGYYKDLFTNIKKANIDILFRSYVAMMYLTTLLAFLAGIILTIFLNFFNITATLPFFSIYEGSRLIRLAQTFWIIFALPALTFLAIYFYPATEKKSIGSKIERELPFAVIHMSSISGSGIAPSEIFRIIGMGKEYPALRKEIRKVLNQINLYGYDLTTSLTNTAKGTPSQKLAELFSGLATTIGSGADLSNFFEKRAETLLLDYRLERERYTRSVETFLDVYISVVIAAPMIFVLLLVMISISGIQIGLSSVALSLIGVAAIAGLNLFFLMFLQLKQPGY